MKTAFITRRSFCKAGAAIAALGGTGRWLSAAQNYGGKTVSIGLQLYTIGGDVRRDMAGSFEAIAKLGYKGVEFAGFNNVAASEIQRMLKANGLQCVGCHTALNTLQGDQLDRTVEFNKIIGNPRLIVPSLSGNYTGSRGAIEEAADLFTGIAE